MPAKRVFNVIFRALCAAHYLCSTAISADTRPTVRTFSADTCGTFTPKRVSRRWRENEEKCENLAPNNSRCLSISYSRFTRSDKLIEFTCDVKNAFSGVSHSKFCCNVRIYSQNDTLNFNCCILWNSCDKIKIAN